MPAAASFLERLGGRRGAAAALRLHRLRRGRRAAAAALAAPGLAAPAGAGLGVLVEWNGWICPLTPLENALRHAAGQAGYAGGFIARYLLPWIYPAGLTPAIQWWLGMLALALNLAWYGLWWRQWRRRRAHGARPVRPVRH